MAYLLALPGPFHALHSFPVQIGILFLGCHLCILLPAFLPCLIRLADVENSRFNLSLVNNVDPDATKQNDPWI